MRHCEVSNVVASILFACLAGLVSCPATASTPVGSASRTYDFDISSNHLAEVLVEIARASGGIVLFDPSLVSALRCVGIHGRFTLEAALRVALEDSGLELVVNQDGSFGVRRVQSQISTSDAQNIQDPLSPPLPRVLSIGVDESDNPNHGYTDIGFVAAFSRSATRTDTPISTIPQSMHEVTSGLIESQQANSAIDALKNISSVAVSRGDGIDQAGTLYVRGFVAPVMKNGVADLISLTNVTNGRVAGSTSLTSLDVPIAAIDRVEVMGGADSIIVGGPMEPGGSVNLITKQPTADRIRELTIELGNDGRRRLAFDMGGSLSEDQIWTSRIILSATNNRRTFDGYDGTREFYLAPSIGYKHSGTSFVAGFSYQINRMPFGGYQSAMLSENGPGSNIRTSPWGRADDHSLATKTEYFYSLEQDLGAGWTFNSKGQFNKLQYDSTGYVGCTPIDLDAKTGVCFADQSSLRSYSVVLDNNLRVKFGIGESRHQLLMGGSYGKTRLSSYSDASNSTPISVPLPPGGLSLPAVNGDQSLIRDDDTIYRSNLYLQDQVKWRRWHALANVGYEQERNNFSLDTDVNGVLRDTSPPRNTPVYNLSLAYQLSHNAIVYANAFRSFTPGNRLLNSTLNGGPAGTIVVPATTGRSVELGLKLSLFDNRATLNAAIYRATHKNVLQFVSLGTATSFNNYVLLPSAISQGAELSLTGRLALGWNVAASYSYVDFRPAQSSNSDNPVAQFPRHRASIWSSYDFQRETWRGWGVALGLTMRTGYQAFSAVDTLVNIPGQTCTDASIYYKSRYGRTTLGVKNLLNRRLYSEFATTTIGVEAGRAIVLTNIDLT